jgi:hypothetical protein
MLSPILRSVHSGVESLSVLSLYYVESHSEFSPFSVQSSLSLVHSGLNPFEVEYIRGWVHSGLSPFGIESIQGWVHLRFSPIQGLNLKWNMEKDKDVHMDKAIDME